MKRIGLLGGMSWESTLVYYRLVNEMVRDRLGSLHSADCLVRSLDFAAVEELQVNGRWDEAASLLADEARSLVRAGAELIVLCTNTMHKVADAIAEAIDVPFIHIADATAEAVKAAGFRSVGLLATAYTMEEDFYVGRLRDAHSLSVLVPDEPDPRLVHDVIYRELCVGTVHESSRGEYRRIMRELADRGAECIVFGCTEIGLLVGDEDAPVPVFDSARLHAEKAVAFALQPSTDADSSPIGSDPLGPVNAPESRADEDFAFSGPGLVRAVELLGHHLKSERHEPSTEIFSLVPESFPEEGVGAEASLEALAPDVIGRATRLGAPGFLAHMDPPTPWPAWAAVLWNAALNQNLLHPETAPVARPLEERVVGWLAPLFGMDGGHFVPGSSVANLTALWAARELRGVEEVVASEASHLSVRKAAALLGLPYREVQVDEGQRLRIERLGDLSRAALVLTAGTVAAGAIDDLGAGTDAAWRHVDAAWAGPLRLSERYGSLLDGVERADSVAVSGHKWFFQPKECGLVFFRDARTAHEAVAFGGGYLALPNVGLLGSHGAAAVPLAATLLAWGRRGTSKRIDRCMEIAAELARQVAGHEQLELFAEPTTGVVLWRPRGTDPRMLRDRLEGAFVSLASLGKDIWLRSVAANPQADPTLVVERVIAALASFPGLGPPR